MHPTQIRQHRRINPPRNPLRPTPLLPKIARAQKIQIQRPSGHRIRPIRINPRNRSNHLRERDVSDSETVTGLGSDVRIPLQLATSVQMRFPALSLPHQRSMGPEPRSGSATPDSIGSSSIDTPTSTSTPTTQHIPITISRPGIPANTFQPVNCTYEAPNFSRNDFQQTIVAMIWQKQLREMVQKLLLANDAFKHKVAQLKNENRQLVDRLKESQQSADRLKNENQQLRKIIIPRMTAFVNQTPTEEQAVPTRSLDDKGLEQVGEEQKPMANYDMTGNEGQEMKTIRTLLVENMDMWHFGENQQTTAVPEQEVQTPGGHQWQTTNEPWFLLQDHQIDMFANHAPSSVGRGAWG